MKGQINFNKWVQKNFWLQSPPPWFSVWSFPNGLQHPLTPCAGIFGLFFAKPQTHQISSYKGLLQPLPARSLMNLGMLGVPPQGCNKDTNEVAAAAVMEWSFSGHWVALRQDTVFSVIDATRDCPLLNTFRMAVRRSSGSHWRFLIGCRCWEREKKRMLSRSKTSSGGRLRSWEGLLQRPLSRREPHA